MLPVITNGLTKAQISALAAQSVDNLLEQGNPLEMAETIAALEEFLTLVKKDDRFKSYVLEETAKYGKGLTTSSGAKIELAEVGTKYDYTVCEDECYSDLMKKKAELDREIKHREQFLKAVPDGGCEIVYEDQVIKVYPPAKSSTSSYKITLAKV